MGGSTLLDESDQTAIDGKTMTLSSDDVPSLAWPFIICSSIHILPAIGFLLMIVIRLPMPIFNNDKIEDKKNNAKEGLKD